MRSCLLIMVVCLLTANAMAAGFLQEDSRVLRAALVFNEDILDAEGLGIEAGFGSALYPLDDVSLFVGYWEIEDAEFRYGGLQIEEHYPISERVIPFAGIAVGYGDVNEHSVSVEGIFGRLQGGVKIRLGGGWSFAATAAAWWSDDDILPEDGGRRDHTASVSTGLTFQY